MTSRRTISDLPVGWKRLDLRRDDRCASCGTALSAGTTAYWHRIERVTECAPCHGDQRGAASGAPRPPAESVAAVTDVAGASANAEYARRADRERRRQERAVAEDAAWRERVTSEHRVLGRLVAAFTPKPVVSETSATRAWKTGARGEERVADVLAGVPGIDVLHDRRWPGRRDANLDHVVVGPSGVFVVDAKKYRGKVELVDTGSWFRPDVRLHVNGRNQTKLVDGVRAQVDAVRLAIGWSAVPVSGVLCFVGAEWGLLGPRKARTLNGVTILWPLGLPELVTASGPVDVVSTAGRLRAALPPAG